MILAWLGPTQVASWWDYGYQTTAMANRTVIVDNNTWNNTHIATVRRLAVLARFAPAGKGGSLLKVGQGCPKERHGAKRVLVCLARRRDAGRPRDVVA